MRQKIYISIILSLLIKTAYCQYNIEWQKVYGGGLKDYLKSIQQTSDGGYIIGGYSESPASYEKSEYSKGAFDYWIIKIDSNGLQEWDNDIGATQTDILKTVRQTIDGGYICVGSSLSNISGDKTENSLGGSDFWILKLDSLGAIQWQNTIGGNLEDVPSTISQTSDGGYIVGGYSDSDSSYDKNENSIGARDYWILKLDVSGNVQWQNDIGGASYDEIRSLEQTNDGGFILGGYSNSNASGDKTDNSKGFYDFWIIKIDSIGSIEWQKTIGGSGTEKLQTIHQTTDNGFIIGGSSDSPISGDKSEGSIGSFDYWIVKTDSVGNILWQNTIGGSDDDELSSLQQTTDGGYVVCGYTASNISGDKLANTNGLNDYWILKLNNSGNLQWQQTFGGYLDDYATCLQQTSDGNFIIGGDSYSRLSRDKADDLRALAFNDYWIMKLAPFSTLTGKLFADMNSNLIKDSGETSFSGKKIYENNTQVYTVSQLDGSYKLSFNDTGTYVMQPLPVNNYTAAPAFHTIVFSALMQSSSFNDFAFQPDSMVNDLQLFLQQVTPMRSTKNTIYNIHYKNAGFTTLSPTIIFYPDTHVTFINATPVQSSLTTDSIVWNLPSLAPFQEGQINITVYVKANLVQNTHVTSLARIEPLAGDANTDDNSSYWAGRVIPTTKFSDIVVNDDSVFTNELKPIPPTLDYVIYFQNTYGDTINTVKIVDGFPPQLDENSFVFISSSHPANVMYNAQGRFVGFELNNIALPDSGINLPGSCGYVHFGIKPDSLLVTGTSIVNFSAIYFDGGGPILTNNATTKIYFLKNAFNTHINGVSSACLDTNVIYDYHVNFNAGHNYAWSATGGNIISGQGTDSITVNWQNTGTHQLMVIECDSAMFLCDSDISVVTIFNLYNSNATNFICNGDSVYLGNAWQSTAGNYIDTLFSVHGCDSVVTTLLTVEPVYDFNTNISICADDSIYIGGAWQSASGTYSDTLQTLLGCDSVKHTLLSVYPVYQSIDTIIIAMGDSVFAGGSWQTLPGNYSDYFSTIYGCDSVITIVLNVLTTINSIDVNSLILIRPNPVTNYVSIEFVTDKKVDAQLSISSPQGQLILRDQLTSSKSKLIDLSSLSQGLYIVQIAYDSKVYFCKLLKE